DLARNRWMGDVTRLYTEVFGLEVNDGRTRNLGPAACADGRTPGDGPGASGARRERAIASAHGAGPQRPAAAAAGWRGLERGHLAKPEVFLRRGPRGDAPCAGRSRPYSEREKASGHPPGAGRGTAP